MLMLVIGSLEQEFFKNGLKSDVNINLKSDHSIEIDFCTAKKAVNDHTIASPARPPVFGKGKCTLYTRRGHRPY